MFFALILFSVLARSVQLLQLFGAYFLTHSVHPICLTLSSGILKQPFSSSFLYFLVVNSSVFDLFM